MAPILSAVVCTYNPRVEYLNQVFSSLMRQTLPVDMWELVVVDNASDPEIRQLDGLFLPEFAQIIVEPNLGLTQARLKGIEASRGEFIIFIDDDNILSEDYLEQVNLLYKKYPNIGIWSGHVEPIFEQQPGEHLEPYLNYLALHKVTHEVWSNMHDSAPLPCGAGMCVHRDVAIRYFTDLPNNPLRLLLGRKGNSLLAGEDTDIGLTACDMGRGVGRSPMLKLHHLIPKNRVQQNYLDKLVEAITYSHRILFLSRGIAKTRRRELVFAQIQNLMFASKLISATAFETAKRCGQIKADADFIRFRRHGILPSI
jgi:glycosyltransferase involved in cell wall biosynthesis